MYFNRKNAEQKNWRMIKKGKHFLFGCSLVFAVGATLATPTVHADNVEAKAEATTSATQAEPTAEAPTYVAPATTSPVATEVVEANSATTVVSADKSQLEAVLAQAKAKKLDGQEASVKAEVEAAITEAEALVANESASQEQVNQSVERLTQAVASVKEVTEATVETTTEAASEETTDSSETPKIRNKRATSEGTSRAVDESRLDRVTVTKDNFDSFFKEGGTANYDETSGTIKLTDDVSGQVGSAYLRFKIDPREDFTFTGKVDIGDKYEGHKVNGRDGGDGVGFVFHTGNVDTIGQSGASIGMGTIKNAFGFKLDSWHNTSNPNANQNASADPKYGNGRKINGKFEWEQNAFGSFYSSNNAGRVTTSSSAAKALNPKPNGEWVDFKIEYKGQSKEFIVTYGSEKWSTNLKTANASIMEPSAKTALNNSNATYALSFLGSTGSGTNLQRVQIEKFEFTAPQIVQVAFYDEAGNELAASSAIPGNRDEVINLNSVEAVQKAISKLEAKGYTLKEVNSEKAETYNAGANTVTLRSGGQLLKYVFAVKDTTPPAAPTVNSVTAGATAVTGTAEAGSTVEVTLPNGSTVSAKADQDGSYSVPVSGLKEGDTLSVTATDDAGNKSTPTSVTVPDTTAPAAPSVNPVKAGDEAITGKAEPGSTVEVTLPGGAKKSATAGEDGSFSIPVAGLNENDEVTVTATDAAKNTSAPTTATVGKADDKTAPAAPSVNPVKAGDEAITGKAEPGSTVEVTLPGGAKKSATAGEDGSFRIPVSGLNENDEVTVTATDAAKNTSAPTTATVGKADDKTAPAAPSVNPVKAGDEAITGKAEPGSTVEVTLPGGAKKSATAGEDGTFSIPVSGLNENDEVSVTATDAANNTSAPTTATVGKAADKTAPEAPSVNPVKAGDEAITGKAEPGSTVEVTLPGGAKKSATAGEDGTFSIPVSGLNENDEVSVTATDAANNTSAPTTATVGKAADKTAPEAPSVNPVKAGDEAITGKAEPGSTVEVTLPGGAKKSATAGEDGTFSIPVSGLNENDEVSVTATDAANNTSAPTTATVGKAADKTAPAAPSVNPVKAGDEAITGKAEPGSTVEVTLPGGAKKSATAGEDGSFRIPVSGLNENDEVTVTATDAAKNTSAPTTATVGKADDKTAPAAPSVNPVKAGDEAITGKAEPGSTVEVTLPGGAKKSATAGEDGTFSIPVSGLNENDEVSVTATDAANNTSAPTTATVGKAADKTAPEAPSVNPVKAGDEAITGKAEPGSTVEVTLPGGAKKSATAGEDGTFSIPVSGLNENDEVSVTATDAANNTSAPTTATVGKAADKTAPEAPSVNPVKAGDEAITGKAEPGSTVEVTLPGGAKKSATAGEDGTFSIPVSGLNENDEVSVTATDAANNTSAPTTATVGKAADKTAPEAPSVNPVKAGDEAITGKAEPGSTVEVTLPGGAKKSATAGEDGTFSIPVSGLNENDEVSVTATDAANNTSAPTTATVGKAADKTAPEAPSVNPVKAGDEAITGKAEPGSTVEVTLPGGAKKSATAGEDGTFSIPVSGLNENDEVSVTATDAANNTSAPTTATVGKAADKTAPEAPSVNPVKAGDEAITGKAEPGSTVEVTLPGGAKKSATAGEDGTFSIPVAGLNENDEVTVTATDAAKNTSAPTTATVGKADDKTAPAAPSVNPVKAGDEAITGKAEPGSTVEVTLPGGAKKSATAGEDGSFRIPVSGLNENDEVTVTATDAANNTSAPTTATVGKADDKTAPAAPSVNPVKAGDEAITGKAEPGSTVEVTLPGGAKKSATAGEDGTFSIPVSGLNENDEVSVTATDAANNTSAPTTATVGKAADKTAPEAPSVNPVKAGDEAITGKAEPGSTVEVTLPGGAKKSATAGEDGTFSIPVSGLNENDEVSVTATDAANNTSAPTTATVGKAADKTAPAAPSVNPVKAGDEAITGKAEPGSTVEVTLPGGAKKSATAGEDGSFRIPVSGLNENDEVTVTATDAAKNTSAPTTATVGKADDKTAPAAPSVNPVKAGDEAITGKAEPGSTVEVTLPGGAKKSATAGEDGTFSIPVSGLNENDEVSVTATDAANNTSAPTTATVGKAADKTAPEAPSVNPVKAGDEAITGKAEPGSTVEVTLPGGAKKSATAGEDGTFSIPVSGLNENDEVSVTATDAANNTSAPTTATVGKAADKTAPEAPSVNPVKAGDEAITGKAEPGSTVEVTLPGGAKKSATAGEDGTFSIPVSGLNENDEVSVTATDAANNTSAPTTATVGKAADKTAPEAPSVNPVKAGDEAITGKAEPGSTVEVTLPGGAKKSATAGEDGTFSIPVSGLNENDEVSVTATDAANNTSAPTTATVGKAADKTAPEAPSVNPVKAGDEAITGKAEPGSTVEVTLPGGAKKSATAGEDGTFSIPVSGLNENDEVSVTATDAANNTSAPTTATVGKAADKTAPEAPSVNPVKAGDEAITGKAEPGSTVEVTLPGGAKKSATAGEDGTFSIPVAGLNENDEVTVTATDAAKNTSAPTTATVGKADDKTAPAAPSVNPVKAGDEAITGKAEPGSTVEVTLPGGAKKSATAGEDGSFRIPVSGLNENDEVTVTATDAAKNTSAPTTATVGKADDKTAPAAPSVNPVKAGDEAITGKAEPGSTVEVTLPGGAKKSATAGEDGTFSIPVSGLNENDEVSVTATDAANNTSAPTTATVGKAADKTAPEAPSVNPVKAGDEAITGKAEPGSTVEVTLPGGAKKSATAGEDGTFSIPVSGLNENDEVSVTATDAANNTSAPTTATVGKAADKTAPEAPSVNPVKAGDEAITGKAEPGSTVEVTLPGGAKKSATAGEDGTFSIPVSGLNENDEVSVTATDAANNTSAPTTATVGKAADKTAPEAPSVNPVKAGDEAITGKAEPGSTVEVTLPGGAKKSATAGEDGTFSIPVSGLNENDEVSVTATDAANNTSAPTTATVGKAADKTAPEAPSVNPVKAGDEAITGKAEPGSTVEVTLPGGAKKSATAGEDGTFSIPVSGLNENDEVSVTATDAANNTSAPTTATVGKAADKTAPEAPSVNPVKAGDEAITGKAEPGSTVEVTLPGGAKKSATAGEDGTFSIPVSGLNENDEVSVTATDAANNTSAPTTATVGKAADKTAPEAPSVNPVKAGDEAITGKAEPGSTVEVTLPGGAKKSATAGEDGTFSIPVAGLNENDEVTVTATDAAKNTSAPTTATVGKADDKTAPAAPSVNPVKAGDEAITGKAEPGSTVEVTLPGGAKKSATAGEDGSFRIPVSGLNENDEVTVTATDAANNTSAPTTATVGKADDKTAPAAPSVNPVKAGDEAITGKAEPGSTVEVTLPGGAKKSATAGEDGTFSIPVSGLNENDEVSVTATDAANNTSAPTTATVGKAADKTAPEAPSVNPVKAGDEAITGKAEPGSTVEVTLPGGAKKSATAGEDGTFSIPVSGLNENDEVSVTATDAANNTSAPTTATVGKAADKTAPAAPSVNPVKAGDEAITGKAEPGSTVEVTLPGGAKKSATAGEDGSFRIPVSGLNENDEVTVTATDAAKNTSAPTTATVGKADDKTAPAAPSVNPVKAGDEAITGKAEPGSTVEVTLPGGAKKSATAGEDGTFSIPVSGLNENDEVSVTATDAANNTSAPTTATVGKAADKTAPEAPSVNPVKAGDEAITGKAEPGSTVEVTLPGGAKKSATAGEDGTFSIPVSGLNENDEVSVTATDAANNTSAPTTATVGKAADKTAPEAPSVNPVKAGDEAITGKAEPGSTVEVTLPGGAKKSATAGEDGTFSIPVSGLNENDEVSVTATDAANNTSAPTTATVGKAADKTAPEAPSVNPVKAGDEAITGKAEPGSTVEVTLPGGAKKSATAGEDGTFSIPVSGLNENDEVSVTATDAANNTSAPTTATVGKAADKTAPEAPSVNPVKAGDEAITGKAEPGSTVEVTLPGGAKKSATAGEDGTFSIPVSGLNENDEVSVTATDAANNTSAPTTATVGKAADKTAPEAPSVNPVKAGDEAITGKAEPGSTVEVTLPGGAKKSATAGEDGTFSIPVAGLNENDEVTVTATDAAKNTSAPTTATVGKADDKTAPAAPSVNPVKAGDEAITGKAEPGSTVEVTLPGGAKKSATAGEDGSFRIPVSGLNENDEVTVTATDAAKNTSAPTTATVGKADDKTAPAAPSVNPVKAGDEAITGKAEPGSTVEVTLPGGAKKSATAGEDGTFSIPVSGLNENDEVSVTATDAANNTSAPTTATVGKAADKTAPEAPSVNPVKAGDEAITGKAEPGSTVEVTLPGGAKKSATAGEDGTFSIPVSGLNENDEVSVTATDAANNTSAPTTATVGKAADKTAPAAPSVNPVKAGDTAVTGTAEAGSTVEVTLPDGTKASATADQDGNFSVPVSGLEEGQTVSVTAKDASNNTSTPTTATVAKADDKTAPDAPVVNPVKAGDTAVTGTAEAGSTVEVTLPDGTKASATADQDGNFSVPVSGLEEGQTVSVTAKDASNNTSTPTTATVAKADDKTAPEAPVVNDVKEGDKAVTGTAEVGSIIEITLPNSETVTVRADEAGHFSLPVVGLKAGDKVTAVAKDASGNTSTPTEKTVGKRDVKESNGVKVPSSKTPVKDTANLTDAEKAKVKEAVEAANPGSKAEVGQDGTTTVTFPDGSTATLTGDQTVKTADSNGVQAPSSKTPVKDTANLTDAEKAKVKEAVEAANPGSKAEVGQDGTTKVTFPDGSTATLTGDQTVKTADSNGVQAPLSKTPVKDTANLTDAEKAKVKEAVEAANPGSKAEVGQDGTTKVTFPDGSTATLTGDKTVTQADITAPAAPVVNPVKAGDTAITGTAEAGSTVEVTLPDGTKVSAKADKDGKFSIPVSDLNAGDTVSVTTTDEAGNTSATTTVTVSKVNVGGKDADNAKVPVLTPVVDPSNLTDAEKAKVAEEVKKANPTATDVKVNNDGSVVVTFADGSVATIAANKVVKEATKESSAQAPAKKAGAKELPNTGTKQSNASLGLALLAAVTGGLLISKKRKEEE